MLTFYVCSFCNERVTWGEIVRVLRRDPSSMGLIDIEQYGHLACVRRAMREEVQLAFARHRPFRAPSDEFAAKTAEEAAGKLCGICGKKVYHLQRSLLTLQRPVETVRAPAFDEETVPVHRTCLKAKVYRAG